MAVFVTLSMGLVEMPAVGGPGLKEYAVAINQAGRQRMLSQKMTKEFLLVVSGLEADANRLEFARTANLFDSTLKRLIGGDSEVGVPAPPTPAIAEHLKGVQAIWDPFRKLLEGGVSGSAPGKDALATVARESVRLVTEMDKVVTEYEQACEAAGFKGTGSVVNVAGRQRMLSQRMTKAVLLLSLGVESGPTVDELKRCRDLFATSLKGLAEGNAEMKLPPTTNKLILKELSQVAELWGPFDVVLAAVVASGGAPTPAQVQEVAQLNSKLLASCQKVVSSYEQESR